MSKTNNVSPAKFKSGSLTDRPYYMPQIKEKSQKQFHASPLIRKRYGPFKNEESELSTLIDSNKSTMVKDSHLKISEPGSQAHSMQKETRLTRLKDPGNLVGSRKSINNNDYINEVFGNSMSDTSHFRQIFIAPKEKLLKAARDETSHTDLSTSRMFENPPSKPHEGSPAKVLNSPLRTINPRRSAPRLFGHSNSATKLRDLGMPRNRSIENSAERYNEDNLGKILSPGALYINPDKEEFSRAHAQETVSEKKRVPKERKIFEYQVKVQLPKLYGQTQPTMQEQDDGPSLYKSKTIHSPRMNLKDFEMKQRSEIKTNLEDALKESYLSYEIGTIHEDKKEFKKAILAFEKFLQASQNNNDKIGIVIALNRLGINYQHLRDFRKSLENHLQTLEYSTQPDYFAAYYNVAIALRKLHHFSQAVAYLQKALAWTKEFKDLESECITQGQIGVTYLEMGNPQMAKEAFQECYGLTIELKHFKLQLDCLVTLSKILRSFKSSESNVKKELWEIYNQAYFCSKKLEKTRVAEICLCNIGVLESSQNFSAQIKTFNFDNISSQIYN